MLSDWQNWQKLHTCITSGQCIYCKCVKALRRQVCTAAKENKPPVSQSTCSIHDCSGAASVHCPADKLRVHSLKEQCEPLLCPTHYQQCVGHATCAWCKSRLTPEHRWKSPNFQLAEHVLRSMHHVRISDESRFCRRCYQKQIDMLPADNAPSTDHQLRSIISQYSTEGAESGFPNIIVIAATGRELLDKDAILLTTVHDLYTETLHPAADPKPAAYVLGKLKLTLEHHLHVIPPKSRKDGTLLLRNGCNVMLRRHYI